MNELMYEKVLVNGQLVEVALTIGLCDKCREPAVKYPVDAEDFVTDQKPVRRICAECAR